MVFTTNTVVTQEELFSGVGRTKSNPANLTPQPRKRREDRKGEGDGERKENFLAMDN